MIEITKYKANDGTIFDSREECINYESKDVDNGVFLFDSSYRKLNLNLKEAYENIKYIYILPSYENAWAAHLKKMNLYDGYNYPVLSGMYFLHKTDKKFYEVKRLINTLHYVADKIEHEVEF